MAQPIHLVDSRAARRYTPADYTPASPTSSRGQDGRPDMTRRQSRSYDQLRSSEQTPMHHHRRHSSEYKNVQPPQISPQQSRDPAQYPYPPPSHQQSFRQPTHYAPPPSAHPGNPTSFQSPPPPQQPFSPTSYQSPPQQPFNPNSYRSPPPLQQPVSHTSFQSPPPSAGHASFQSPPPQQPFSPSSYQSPPPQQSYGTVSYQSLPSSQQSFSQNSYQSLPSQQSFQSGSYQAAPQPQQPYTQPYTQPSYQSPPPAQDPNLPAPHQFLHKSQTVPMTAPDTVQPSQPIPDYGAIPAPQRSNRKDSKLEAEGRNTDRSHRNEDSSYERIPVTSYHRMKDNVKKKISGLEGGDDTAELALSGVVKAAGGSL